jgi:uncharacterized protein (TIGR03437 family)
MSFTAIVLAVFPLAAQVSVLTYQYDLTRAGANTNETALTPANVNASQFGKLYSYPVDGYIYAQPLYAPNVTIAGRGSHNVVYVVTEHDSVYAFDADGPGGDPLWQKNFLGPGVTTVPASDTGCNQIEPELGISGTPVIDPQSQTMYMVAMTKETSGNNANYVQRLHALDITSGAERPGSPVIVQATYPGTGEGGSTNVFRPKNYKARPGLLLLNGTVYTSWSSHCDGGTYHGWLIGYDARTLAQTAVYNSTPNGNEGSFWGGGAAPAADAAGNIYVVTGNGSWDYASGGPDLGESYIRLTNNGRLVVADYFTPFNQKDLNDGDVDTGSGGVALLGDDAGSSEHPHLMVGAGKEGRIYLLDRDSLGHYQSGSDSQIVQSFPGAISGVFGNPAYFNQTIYFCGSGDGVRAFPIANAQMATAAASSSPTQFGYPGCLPTVSSNGKSNGIVWALETSNTLHAYDASDLSNELYNSNQNQDRDDLGDYVKFTAPTVANGKVFAGTQSALVVYGLLPGNGVAWPVSNAASGDANQIAPGSIVSVYGQGLALATTTSNGYPLPGATVGGASMTIGGWPAPIVYASPGQLTAQVPFEVSPGGADVTITVGGVPWTSGSIAIQAQGPAIFIIGQGHAAALNLDYSVNSPAQPAPAGGYISLFVTGLGPVSPAVATGVAGGANPPSTTTTPVTATIGGQPATVVYAGLAPGYAGLYQINLVVPKLSPGNYPVQIFQAGGASNTPLVNVR